MSDTYFSFEGLNKWEKELNQLIEVDYPRELEDFVKKLASQLQGKIKELTPRDTSRLADNWELGEIVKRGDEYFIEVYNNIEYASHVEYGHRTRSGKGFVPGKHMMEISINKFNDHLPLYLQRWVNDFINNHNL